MKKVTDSLFPAPRFVSEVRQLSLAWPLCLAFPPGHQKGRDVLFDIHPKEQKNDPRIFAGLTLVGKKLASFGTELSSVETFDGPELHLQSRLRLSVVSEQNFTDTLITHNMTPPSDDLFPQAYFLNIQEVDAGVVEIQLQSPGPLGLFYGCQSIFQLLKTNQGGYVTIPQATIIDWPELAIRLGKVSASLHSRECLDTYVTWLPILRLSQIGLQYHGGCSRSPEKQFLDNLAAVFDDINRTQLLEGYVYFCPFRGGGTVTDRVFKEGAGITEPSRPHKAGTLDLSLESDRNVYAQLLRHFLDLGAKGIEVDYNDWAPASDDISIENVLNFVAQIIDRIKKGTRILYCPADAGNIKYHGPCSAEMTRLFSRIPTQIWPLWCGSHVVLTYHAQGLTSKAVESWIDKAGRRPFLWVNRVMPCGQYALARVVGDSSDTPVFMGETLPQELHACFEGVNLNLGVNGRYTQMSPTPNTQALIYLATATAYFWNPRTWNGEDVLRRATQFISEILPFV